MPAVSEQLGMLAAQVGMVNSMLSGMEASGTQLGEWYVPNKHFLYSAQVLAQDLYPRLIQRTCFRRLILGKLSTTGNGIYFFVA